MRCLSRRWSSVFALSIAALLGSPGPGQLLHAQAATGALSGTIVDQAGKPIPNATVEAKNSSTEASSTVNVSSDGRFSIPDLPAGNYSVIVAAPGFSLTTRPGAQVTPGGTQDIPITMTVESVSTTVTVAESISSAAATAPSGNTLEALSARTEVTPDFIKNFMSPIADYSEFVNYAPGTFSLNPNGIGLGQGSTYFRGFQDGQYTMTFDGIPFEDTNTPTHHSWANFPSGWTNSVDFDRSAGLASDIGPTNFGGSIHLQSPPLFPDPDVQATYSYGSWDTRLLQLDADSGFFGPGNKSSFLMDVQQLLSNGYQTFNKQKRDAGYGKYQYRFNDHSALTLYGGLVDIWTNTPKSNNPTAAQVAQYGDDFLLQGNEYTSPGVLNGLFYGFDYYHVQTDFEYADYNADLGGGWRFDTKAYTTRYWNKQNYTTTPISLSTSKPSGVDKLNGYRHAGDTVTLSQTSNYGVFRTGAWYDWAYTDRYQIPTNPLTGVDTPLGNFHEHFVTQSIQPFAEYEWHPTRKLVITAGIKAADYNMVLNQYQDNGKTVGCLGGLASTDPVTKAPICIGGGAFTTHAINWNNWLPNLAARYFIKGNWSAYAQWSEGSVIPPSGVFDTPNGQPLVAPKPTVAKTYQVGSVIKFHRWTLDGDAYYVHFQNAYDTYTDPVTAEPISVASGPLNTKGLEAESNIIIGWGFTLYLNGSLNSTKYQEGGGWANGGLWEANAPKNIETISLLYRHKNWDFGFIDKRVGTMYNDNGTLTQLVSGIKLPVPVDQAITIQPFTLLNFFANYTIKNSSMFRGSKIGLAINNLTDSHNLVGITPAVAATAAVPYVANSADQWNLLPGRSVMMTFTAGWAPRR